MDELSFKFQETAVRTLLIEREPWFVGKDVAEALATLKGRFVIL